MVVGRPDRAPAGSGLPDPGRGAVVRREDQKDFLDPNADAQSAAGQAHPEKEQPDPEPFTESEAQTQGIAHAHAGERRDAQTEEEKILADSIA